MITPQHHTDTLMLVAEPLGDSLAHDLPLRSPATDSLIPPAPSIAPRYREVTSGELFGTHSEQAELPYIASTPDHPTTTSGYGALVLALVVVYTLLIYRHTADIRQLLGRLVQDRSTDDRLYDDSGSSFSRFLTLCSLMSLLLLGVVVMRLVGGWFPAEPLLQSPHTAALMGCLVLVAALGIVQFYRWSVCSLIGVLTRTQSLFAQLILAKRTFLSLLTIAALPPAALWLLTPIGTSNGWFAVIIIELIISLILYLHETYQLFLAKKISILHWILYLCTVEIFPLSLLWLMAVRSM